MPRVARRHTVLVDTREPKSVQLAIQSALPDEIELCALHEADFALPDQDTHLLGVERKTVTDFLSSLADGRLAAQLTRMSESYSIQGLIIEGGYSITGDGQMTVDHRDTHWGHASLQMTLYSLQRHFPELVVWWSNNLGGTADIIRALAARGMKGCFDDTTLLRKDEGNGPGTLHTRSGGSRRRRVAGGSTSRGGSSRTIIAPGS